MKKQKASKLNKLTAMLLALVLAAALPGTSLSAKADSAVSLSNPRILADSSMEAGQKTTYDCVYFGSYPQTEIVAKASDCGTYGKGFYKESDCIADSSLYSKLSSATGWDDNGDITLDGTKYRRIQLTDTMNIFPDSELSWAKNFYLWANSSATYRYFRYEPIKWRVLYVNGSQALLLADTALDCQKFYPTRSEVDWSNSTIRSWLNGYDASANSNGTDYSETSFMSNAFTSEEQGAILNKSETHNFSTVLSGEDTSDKIFFLTEYDVYYSGTNSTCYGFEQTSAYYDRDEALMCKNSTYAKAMGGYAEGESEEYYGNCLWWLRTLFTASQTVELNTVRFAGYLYHNPVNYGFISVRPALSLNLSSSSWSFAGTVCTDGTVVEDTASLSHTHQWDVGTVVNKPNCVAIGLKKYTCSGCDEIKYEILDMDPDNHLELITEEGEKATCTETGTTDKITCNLCGRVIQEHEEVEALGHDKVIDYEEVPATCRTSGYTEGSHCSICNAILSERTVIPSPGHIKVTDSAIAATTSADGKTACTHCANCDKVYAESEVVPKINKIKLSFTTAVYDGKTKTPVLKIYDREGSLLTNKTDYTVSVPSGRKNVGIYTYTITFKGNYAGTEKLTLTINPKGTSLSSITALTKSFKVKWKKNSTQTTGYQLQYSTSGSFASGKTKSVTVSGTSTTTKTIKNLKAKTKYYVRIRTYKKVSGKTYYSAWSAKKYVKTK